ncbi:MAG: HEAT repeat domain-containing protein [Acidobacteria bacterium]|nr:HEAT repeat domain-containing protein [Acidobacteriota bacterium]MBV9479488.1 HEAT repeat domain-containing protein [Acidobacteriota bacterium]
MSAAAVFRVAWISLSACLLFPGQSHAAESERARPQAEHRPSASPQPSTQQENDEDQTTSPQEPVTIPNPSLPPLDGAWQLLEAGVKSPRASERAIALHGLGLVRDNSRAEKLAESRVGDDKPEVRAAAAEALGKIGKATQRGIAKLKEMLDDKDNKVVLSAAQALIELKNNDGYEVYYEILTGERKTGVGLIASQEAILKDPRKLFALGFHEGLGFVPFGGISWEAFKTITKDDKSPLRAAAAQKLAQDPDPATTKGLVMAAGDKSWLVRAAALEALARRGDASALKTAALYLYDDRPEVKYVAAGAVIGLSARASREKQD